MSTEQPSTLASLEQTLPRASYLDASEFQREYAAIFESNWVCVGRSDTITEPGDYLAIRLQDQSLLVVRTDEDELSAFYNVCRHRGTELVPLKTPAPSAVSFLAASCAPTHGAITSTAGCGAPHIWLSIPMVPLHTIPLAEWGGFIFVVWQTVMTNRCHRRWVMARDCSATRSQISEWITPLLTTLKPTGKSSSRTTTSATTVAIHPELCQIVPAFKQSGGNELDWDDGVPHREGANTFTTSGTTARAPFPGLSDTEKTHHKGELFYPNLMLSLSMDHVAAFYLWPQGAGHTRIQCDFLFHPEELSKPDFDGSDAVEFWDVVNQQDWDICESVQRGMHNKVFEHGYYAPMEDYSLDIRRYVREKLDKADGECS